MTRAGILSDKLDTTTLCKMDSMTGTRTQLARWLIQNRRALLLTLGERWLCSGSGLANQPPADSQRALNVHSKTLNRWLILTEE